MKEKLGIYVLGFLIAIIVVCAGAILIDQCQKRVSVIDDLKSK